MEQEHQQRTSVRLVVVDPELDAQCERVEQHLLTPLVGAPRDGCDHALFAGGLAAFRRVRAALAEAVARGPRVWTPNGRWEHEGLRVVRLPTEETDLLYALLRELSGALVASPQQSGGVAAFLSDVSAEGESAAGLVGALARVLSMVDLTPDADTDVLLAALEAAGDGTGDDVRLSYAQEEAWQRLAHRVTMLLTESAPLHRFLY
ncbi:hypothetical protein [Streptomyces sp. Ru72]|uniref:hypothetical protein n=1 Tax=Streptomyces sp. Ru72 TaxID=2080747 RepID=UPI000CDD3A79|nr:hypothetical protein [Streptomyces sp. Ru72]POX53270.1 hypothetical protein C3488_05985 [Streptomyces sp. Ru72]